MLEEQSPIGIGEVISETFEFIGDRAATVFGVAFLVILPERLLIIYLATHGVFQNVTSGSLGNYGLALLAISALGTFMAFFGQGVLVGTALQRRDGRQSDLLGALAAAARRLPIALPVSLLYLAGFILGFVLLVVPGIMLLTMWAVVGPVLVAERTGLFETFSRSRALTRNTRWRIFLLLLVAGIAVGGLNWLLQRLGMSVLETRSLVLSYAVEPAPFLYVTLLSTIAYGFQLAMVCTLYIVLIERRGDGPTTDRLTRIFE
ncbi:MAG TPA: hypothetical protein VK533_05775 [Sphingomonas sp.]|uniref:hypothetical protein n=1 Tax=Sphingomonas sp. TaxID=28214 RepID=UPI002CB1FDEC|nr:hypothetical protein [Sphingomonas sp.]HMI19035.1 hypothetical protein [Sphingomonas sp.]